ncbi:MAG TPA: ParB/RepB/Spo0J family partition protein [Candidatus Binataceae bacterium]|nr:ParB/RepB/Spo0J family partition protein [Candidatus Binataceae bacterium]
MPASEEFTHIDVAKLHESKLNPRKTFLKLDDLKASIAAVGKVLTPLLVRPGAGGFEILGGARRFRAAKALGLETVPARVLADIDDKTALEIIVIDNLQREDVQPLEEAEGYQALMKEGGYDVEALAKKIGKSQSFVYQRLKLCELITPVKRALASGELTAGHAILLARLQPRDQKEALQTCAREDWDDDGGRKAAKIIISVRELASWIKRELQCDLSAAPWKKDDPGLLADAGACSACPKNTANMVTDDAAGAKPECTDRECFQAKLAAHLERRKRELAGEETVVEIATEYGSNLPKSVHEAYSYRKISSTDDKCDHMVKGLVVHGHDIGQVYDICVTKNCAKHRSYSSGSGEPERRDEQRLKEKKAAAESVARRKTLAAVAEKVNHLSPDDLRLVIRGYLHEMCQDAKRLMLKHLGLAKDGYQYDTPITRQLGAMKEPELARLLVTLALINTTVVGVWNAQPATALNDAAKRYRVTPVKPEPVTLKKSKSVPKKAAPKSGRKAA